MWNKCSRAYVGRCSTWGSLVVAFGLGMTVSCCCPFGLIMFIAALIITALGIIVIRK